MATIGRRSAVVQLAGGLRLTGTLAWLAWFALHLVYLLGGRNRVDSADQPDLPLRLLGPRRRASSSATTRCRPEATAQAPAATRPWPATPVPRPLSSLPGEPRRARSRLSSPSEMFRRAGDARGRGHPRRACGRGRRMRASPVTVVIGTGRPGLAAPPMATRTWTWAARSAGVPAPDFRLDNQFGQPMSLSQFRGKVVMLAFDDSECTTVCPLTTQSMVEAKQTARRRGRPGPAARHRREPRRDQRRRRAVVLAGARHGQPVGLPHRVAGSAQGHLGRVPHRRADRAGADRPHPRPVRHRPAAAGSRSST